MSTIEIPQGSLFGLDNLPYGCSRPGAAHRGSGYGSLTASSTWAALRDEVFAAPKLNPFMAEGPARWAAARARITELITAGDVPAGAVHPVRDVSNCGCRSRWRTTSTSTRRSTTRPTSAGSSGPTPSR
jgi:fumarylacetoacetase